MLLCTDSRASTDFVVEVKSRTTLLVGDALALAAVGVPEHLTVGTIDELIWAGLWVADLALTTGLVPFH